MIRLGNFLFRHRNALFPVAYLLLFAKTSLITPHYHRAALVGLALALAGQILRAATIGLDYIRRGGKDRQVYADDFVTGGLFAHCRNPLYLGNYLVLTGLGVASCSLAFVALGLPLFALAYWAIIQAEEDFLRRKFGQAFEDYCSRVGRLTLNPKGLGASLRSMEFNWRRLITAEYGAAAAWAIGLVAVTLHNAWLAGEHTPDNAVVLVCWALAGCILLAYLVARFLKKSGWINDERPRASG